MQDKKQRVIVKPIKVNKHMKNIIRMAAVAAAVALSLSACTEKFEEINTDPDAYSTAPVTNILGYCIVNMATNWGDELTHLSDWMGYTALAYDAPTYNILPTNNEFGNRWYQSYTLYPQLQDIIDRVDPDEAKNITNVAKLMQTWLLLLAADSWGDIPYSEAFQGTTGGEIKPKFDDDYEVYQALEARLKEISDSWSTGLGSDDLGEGDFLYGGDAENWQRFCNSLRLRYAMRLSEMPEHKAASEATFKEICGNPSKYPVIEDCSQNCEFWWDGSANYRERWYDNSLTRPTDWVMSQMFIDHLKAYDDPRIAVFAQPVAATGEYRGMVHGPKVNYNGEAYVDYSAVGTKYRYDAKGSSPYFRACETWFLIAEAAVKGWSVGTTAEQAYNRGVECSFTDNDMPEQASAYLAGKAKFDGTLDRIYTEEWIGLYKMGQECWALYRRTGYPQILELPKVTYSTGTTCKQYPGEKSAWGDKHNDIPFRFPYPNNEFTYNEDNVNAASKDIVDYVWGKQICWDLRTGVK